MIANPSVHSYRGDVRRRAEALPSQILGIYSASSIRAPVFILASLQLLNGNGTLTFISSVTWQTGENYSALRQHLFASAGVHTLVNLPFDVFEAAYINTGVYIISKQRAIRYRICLLDKKANFEELQRPHYVEVAMEIIQPPRFKLGLNPSAASVAPPRAGRTCA